MVEKARPNFELSTIPCCCQVSNHWWQTSHSFFRHHKKTCLGFIHFLWKTPIQSCYSQLKAEIHLHHDSPKTVQGKLLNHRHDLWPRVDAETASWIIFRTWKDNLEGEWLMLEIDVLVCGSRNSIHTVKILASAMGLSEASISWEKYPSNPSMRDDSTLLCRKQTLHWTETALYTVRTITSDRPSLYQLPALKGASHSYLMLSLSSPPIFGPHFPCLARDCLRNCLVQIFQMTFPHRRHFITCKPMTLSLEQQLIPRIHRDMLSPLWSYHHTFQIWTQKDGSTLFESHAWFLALP